MQRKKTDKSEMVFKSIVIFAVILTIGIGVWWFWPEPKPVKDITPLLPKKHDVEKSEEAVQPEPQTIIHYDKDDEEFKTLMDRRKTEYGLDKGVDMIVKADESVEIGDVTIPMEDILSKIRLKKGDFVEEDLASALKAKKKQESIDRLFDKLRESEARFWELEKSLITLDHNDIDKKIEEHANLAKIMESYQEYKQALKKVDNYKKILGSDNFRKIIQDNIDSLEQRKDALEKELQKMVSSKTGRKINKDDNNILFEELDKINKRFLELENILAQNKENENNLAFQKYVQERAGLRKIIAGYDIYKQIIDEIEDQKALLLKKDDLEIKTTIKNRLKAFRIKRDDIENFLKSKLLPGESVEVYGVYVVRSGDNIWNIHFEFLKEYFKSRNIILSARSDEPIRPGVSSGVGKILKFSENMVHIYNLREQSLSANLNIIHPMSKIVVFNMGQALDLLNQVDYENIKHIRFDGENLWIPAQQ